MTQERFSCENCRSRPMEGSATLTIDASSTTTNWASARRARASHFRSGATVGLKVVSGELVCRDSSLARAARPHIGSSERPPHRRPLGLGSRALGLLRNWSSAFGYKRYGIDV